MLTSREDAVWVPDSPWIVGPAQRVFDGQLTVFALNVETGDTQSPQIAIEEFFNVEMLVYVGSEGLAA